MLGRVTVAAYLRVSSRSQEVATQRDAIERCAKARSDAVLTWFVEKRSAKNLDRPELAALREAVRRGEVRAVYVFRLDRFARSGIRDTFALLDELRSAGCRVVTVADGFDLDGPLSEVVTAVMAWAAQMERLALGERIAAARTRVEAAGGSWGRPRRADSAMLAQARELQEAGRSLREIAIALKIPRSTLQGMLAGNGPYGTKKKGPKNTEKNRGKKKAAIATE
jgi:DNA invertase Pin-like site-specific DNA recombinase